MAAKPPQKPAAKSKKSDMDKKGKAKNRSKRKVTSIGASRNSRDNSKDGVRQRKGR